MKKQIFKTILSAFVLVMLCGLFATTATAQNNTSVTITVNPKPTLTVVNDTIKSCPERPSMTYYNNTNPALFHIFNVPTDAGVTATANTGGTSVTYEYNTARDFSGATITAAEIAAYSKNAGTLDSVFVRAYQETYTSCFAQVQKIVLQVYTFPNLNIDGTFAACANSTASFSISDTVPTGTTFAWSLKDNTVGTLTNATTNAPSITWAENLTGAVIKDTLILAYTTPDGCTFTVKQELTVSPRPKFTTTDTTACYIASVDLTKRVSVDVVDASDITYSTTSDFATTISDPDEYADYTTAGFTDRMFYVKATSSEGCANIDSFKVTVYPQIEVDLQIVVDNNNSIIYEECANEDGSTTQQMTLRLKVTGGCPNATNYVVTLTTSSGIVIGTGTDVAVNGNELTIPYAAANTGVTFTVTVPVNGAAYNIGVSKVGQDGTAPCNCSQTF